MEQIIDDTQRNRWRGRASTSAAARNFYLSLTARVYISQSRLNSCLLPERAEMRK